MVLEISQQVHALEERIKHAETWLKLFMKQSALCRKFAAIDGVGTITATAMVASVGEAKEFKNGRRLSALARVGAATAFVRRQVAAQGHQQARRQVPSNLARSRRMVGAALRGYAVGKTDVQSRWLQDPVARRGYNCAAVALANKNARVIQALLSSDTP